MDDESERVLQALLVPELLVLVALGALLVGSLTGSMAVFGMLSRSVRLALLGVLCLELALPLGVYLDLRRRGERGDIIWVHAAAMPVVNVLGVLAYLEQREE